MDASIICSLIGALASIIAVFVSSKNTRDKVAQELQTQNALQNQRLDSIEKKIDEHNGYAQKFGEVAIAINSLQKDIEFIKSK